MRELRTCPVTGVMVLLNDGWPDQPADLPPPSAGCWPCEAVASVIVEVGALRAVPHPVPALGIEGSMQRDKSSGAVRRDAVGAHELLFGEHDGGGAGLLDFAGARIADLRRDRRLRGFRLLREWRPGAHPVWQLFALPVDDVPGEAGPWRNAELGAGTRVVAREAGAVAIAAWAPRVPFEVWVLPTGDGAFPSGSAAVEALGESVAATLSAALGGAVVKLVVEAGEPWRLVLRPVTRPSVPTGDVDLPGHGVFPERAAVLIREWLTTRAARVAGAAG